MKTLITLILFSFSLVTFGRLAPTAAKPLFQHLIEVNPEWTKHIQEGKDFKQLVQFKDEDQRIQRHLLEVCTLLEFNSESYSADLKSVRMDLIDQLRKYANAKQFPINTEDAVRLPYFIDVEGTACAVGYLMLENGFESQANWVHEKINKAYIREIPESWLQSWMDYSALSLDELALIQPSYPPSTIWENLNSNLEGTIYTMWPNGSEMILAGDFTLNGEAASIATFDGTNLIAWPEAINGVVKDLILYQDKLYACGAFQGYQKDIAVWDNNTWTYSNAVSGKTSEAYDLLVMNGELYCSTSYSGFAGYDYFVMKKNGNFWETIGSFDEVVDCMYEFDGQLVVGGEFENLLGEGIVSMPFIAVMDEFMNWSSPAGGLNAPVYALAEFDGKLIAAGSVFDESNEPANFFRMLDVEGWSEANDSGFLQIDETYAVKDIHESNGRYFFSGNYSIDNFGTFGADIVEVNFIDDGMGGYYIYPDPLLGFAAQTIHKSLLWNGSLYIGGDFATGLDGPSIFARTEIESAIEILKPLDLLVYPNPSSNTVNVELPNEARNGSYHVLDITGRIVEEGSLNVERMKTFEVSAFQAGNYIINLYDASGKQIASSKISVL